MPSLVFTLFGILFGFVLSRGRVTDYDTIAGMFRLAEFHLFGVIGSAIATAALGLWLLRRTGNRALGGAAVEVRRKPWNAGAVAGGLVLGAGWALSGACPGTSLVQLGEGKLLALFTVVGILAGTYVYGWLRSRYGGALHPDRQGGIPMRTTLVLAVIGLTLLAATAASAQQPQQTPPGHQHDSTQPAPPAAGRGGMGPRGGMMGGMHQGGMHGGMHGMMHEGMMGGGMCGMMGGMGMAGTSDPKTLARMLQLRGEMMKAVGEVLLKHGQALEVAPAR
jgi:uncharacterized membrane protein YedE/YeeE